VSGALMPPFIEPQFPKLVDRAPVGPQWIHEVKFDGYRTQLRVEKKAATIRTRRGHDWTDKFPALVRAAAKLPDCIIDGELCALDEDGKPDFPALLSSLYGDSSKLVLFAFDLLYDRKQDMRGAPLLMRKHRLREVIGDRGRPFGYSAHTDGDGNEIFAAACRGQLEGIVSKCGNAPYRSGKGESWVKVKCRPDQELVIGGWTQNGAAFRSLLLGAYEDGKFRYVGKVGTGFGGRLLDELMPKLKAHQTSSSPFAGKPPRSSADIYWTKPRLVAQVQFAGWTGDGQVRQASFKGLRADKPANTVTFERPVASA
jgi:bifunctional non-homologous end joining protein LigD